MIPSHLSFLLPSNQVFLTRQCLLYSGNLENQDFFQDSLNIVIMSYLTYENLCKLHNVKTSDVCKATGISPQTISAWKKGEYEPKADKRRKISDYFGVPLSYLDRDDTDIMTDIAVNDGIDKAMEIRQKELDARNNTALLDAKEKAEKRFVEYALNLAFWNTSPERRKIVAEILGIEFHETEEKVKTLPFYGNIAAAGTSVNSYDILMHGTIECPDNRYTAKADYAIGVCGDSMEPEFHDGDIVLVMKRHTIEYGAIGIFQVDNDIYIKKLTRDGLKSLNENYQTIKNSRDIICLGEVIGRIEDLK